jgi:Tol biopolymer transport system component
MVIAGAVFLAAAAFLAGRLLAPGGGTAGEAPMRLEQLTFDGGVELQPRLSPDGGSFLFVADREGGLDIYLQRVGGEAAINLTADYPERDYQPAFSPDGRQIAFRSERDGGGIFVMGATGESARRLTDFGYNPAWTPDGGSVIVSTESIFNPAGRQTSASLSRIDATTGARTPIEGPHDAVQPRVSPSGERIAFWGLPEGTGTRVLYTMPAAGGAPVPLTDDPHMNWNPVWAPDGSSLYFASDRGGRMNVWRLPIDGTTGSARGEPVPVTQSTEAVGQFDVGPEGQLLFASSSLSFALERVPWDVAAAKVTGPPVTVLETSRVLGNATPSPDERWLAIWARDQFEDLFVAAADGTKLRRLTNDTFRDRGPVWGPDSETIYIYSDRGGRYEVWRIRRDGSGLEQVTATEGEIVTQQLLSPDGTRMTMVQGGHLALADLTGSLPVSAFRELPPPEGLDFFATAWSPDGTRLVGVLETTGEETTSTWILSVDDGSYRKVVDGIAVIGWPSERRLLGVTDPDGDLVVVDPQTGESQPVAGFTGEIGQIVATPGSLLNRRTRTQGDIWMLSPQPPTGS